LALGDERPRPSPRAAEDLRDDGRAGEDAAGTRHDAGDTDGVICRVDLGREKLAHHRGDDRRSIRRDDRHPDGSGSARLSIRRALGERAATIARAGRAMTTSAWNVASSTIAA